MGNRKIKMKSGTRYESRWLDENGRDHRKLHPAGTTKEEADDFLRDVKVRITRIKQGLEVRERNAHHLTITQLAARYVDGRDSRLKSVVRLHIQETALGVEQIERVTRGRVLEHLDSLHPAPPSKFRPNVKEKLSKSMQNHVRKHLHAMFNLAIEREWLIGVNPVSKVKRKKTGKRHFETLTVHEVERLLVSKPQPWAGILAAAMIGLRKGEIWGLDDADVDTALWQLNVHRSHAKDQTKNGGGRVVPIHPVLRPFFTQALQITKSHVLFPGKGGTKRRSERAQMARELASAFKIAKITKALTFHDLRHTAATLMLQAGAPIHMVSKALGHKNISITVDLYGHLVVEDVRRAIEMVPLKLDLRAVENT